MATTHILLPRGINVAGNNRIGMAALRAALEAAGYTGVKSYLQSGNVVVTSSSSPATRSRSSSAAGDRSRRWWRTTRSGALPTSASGTS